MTDGSLSRRDLFRGGRNAGALLALSALLPGDTVEAYAVEAYAVEADAVAAGTVATASDVYRSIGGSRPLGR